MKIKWLDYIIIIIIVELCQFNDLKYFLKLGTNTDQMGFNKHWIRIQRPPKYIDTVIHSL